MIITNIPLNRSFIGRGDDEDDESDGEDSSSDGEIQSTGAAGLGTSSVDLTGRAKPQILLTRVDDSAVKTEAVNDNTGQTPTVTVKEEPQDIELELTNLQKVQAKGNRMRNSYIIKIDPNNEEDEVCVTVTSQKKSTGISHDIASFETELQDFDLEIAESYEEDAAVYVNGELASRSLMGKAGDEETPSKKLRLQTNLALTGTCS